MSADNKIQGNDPPKAKSGSNLPATDRPSEKLLNRIAQHIVYDHLPTVALELGINKAQLSCITAAFNIHVQRFEVIFVKVFD